MADATEPEDDRLQGDEPEKNGPAASPQLPGRTDEHVGAGAKAAGTRSWPVGATTVWAMVVWGAVVVGASVPLAILGVSFWWIIPVLGAIVPFVFVALQNRELGSREAGAVSADRERELLRMLRERGELTTPVMASLETSLTVREATGMLEKLARKGHLRVLSESGVMAYELPAAPEGASAEESLQRGSWPSQELAGGEASRAPFEPLAEPLSDREMEVLRLLASGLTNREIAGNLFIAVGTVKNHTNGIYRKLGVHNRAGALHRARELDLLN
jgi:DNA-binding CsgD family transcriptional regulator